MESSTIFQQNEELGRLCVQNRLLKKYEQPIYQRTLAGHSALHVLDIGCNNGSKTVERFSGTNIKKVIGLEYCVDLATQAQEQYGSEVFAFYPCDVEQADFLEKLTALMEQNELKLFDVIHVSFVLMHLKNARALLEALQSVLEQDGYLIVVEADDSLSTVSPDPNQLWSSFSDILASDPFSGDRVCGGKVPELLAEIGYRNIVVENRVVQAGVSELEKKEEMFTTFCSYLPADVCILRQMYPENMQYQAWENWIGQYFAQLRSLILEEGTIFTAGISIIICRKK